MPFLDKEGLAHFWNQIIARLNTLIDAKSPDWNASEGEAGYVQNRTHWEDEDGTVHKLDMKFIEVVSEEDFLAWLNEAQVVEPVTSSTGEVYTTNNNEIYIL